MRSTTVTILLFVLSLCGCGSGGDSTATPHTSRGANYTPIVVKLDRYYDNNHIKESGLQRIGLQINIYDASEIIYVIEKGFEWERGLREGYEIISVNGIPIDSLGYFGIYELLADTSINEYQFLVVTTDGDTEDVTISVQP